MFALGVPSSSRSELLRLDPLELLHRKTALVELVKLLLASLLMMHSWSEDFPTHSKVVGLGLRLDGTSVSSHLLLLLVLRRGLQDGRDVLGETELLQRLGDVIAGDGLLGLLLGDLVRLGRDERDELDAALDQQVPCLLGERDAVGGREDLGDDLLDRRLGQRQVIVPWEL